MIEELKQLKEIREDIETRKTIEADLEAQYKATEEYKRYVDSHDDLVDMREQATELEEKIKEAYIGLSKQTGFDVRDFGPVKIKEFTKVTITDSKLAVAWAALNAPMCLSLTKDFEKVAKTLELPFAKIEKEYRAQIATDLSNLEG